MTNSRHDKYINRMLELLCVGLGCACGAMLRFLVQHVLDDHTYDDLAIMVINVSGCAVLGFFNGWIAARHPSNLLKKFLTTGFCGGLTTFSSFSGDTFETLKVNPGLALAFIAGNMILGIMAYYFASQLPWKSAARLSKKKSES